MGADTTIYGLVEMLTGHAGVVFATSFAVPIAGTAAAMIGKGGETEEDGRFIASAFVFFGFAVFLLEVLLVLWFAGAMNKDPFTLPITLLLAPIVCCVGCLFGIRRVFPLKSLWGYRKMMDVFVFSAISAAILWAMSRFHWGIIFWGGMLQLAVIFVVVAAVLRKVFRRVTGRE